MGGNSKREYLAAIRVRYRQATKKEKGGPAQNPFTTQGSFWRLSSESGWPPTRCVERSWWRQYRSGCRSTNKRM